MNIGRSTESYDWPIQSIKPRSSEIIM